MSDQPPRGSSQPRNILKRIEQLALAAFLLCGIVSMGGYWAWHGSIRGRLIEVEENTPLSAQFQVDVNTATWPELAQLPGIGETMARRIVDERMARGQFEDHGDLQRRVQGIGPRTLERMRPYLTPMPDMRNVAGGDSAKGLSGG